MDLFAVASETTDTRAVIAGPVIGAAIALVGIYLNQLMHGSTQERTRYRNEVRDLAGSLLTLSERLWRRGWEMHQAHRSYCKALEPDGPESVAAQEAEPERIATMHQENETHEEILSIQRRLMIASPALDNMASELVEGSRLWPPSPTRPGADATSRRSEAERAFVSAVRKELGAQRVGLFRR